MGYVAADYTSWVAGARCVGGARPSLGASFGAGVHHGAALRFGRRAALPFGAAYGGAASTPCAVGMGVGTITDAGGGPSVESRTSARGRRGSWEGVPDVGAYSSAGHNITETLYFLGCVCPT